MLHLSTYALQRGDFMWLYGNKALWSLVWPGHTWGPQNSFRGALSHSCFHNNAKMLFVILPMFSLVRAVHFSRSHKGVLESLL